jgi:DNA modification methylase
MKLINSDCIATMKAMPDNFIDLIVTDPPYELGFMGKSWDSTGIAFNIEVWQEALRVLKPGGHLIAFSGSRTYHRMAVAIKDAGFEIRDQIMWVYGSGFPKSHDVSKAIDKAAGAEREVVGEKITSRALGGSNWKDGDAGGMETVSITAPATESAKQWDGWGTALKPAHEPMVLARKPIVGTVANNVLTYGTGGLNIDGSRVAYEEGGSIASNPLLRKESGAKINYGLDKSPTSFALKTEEGEMQINNAGRFPANFIHDGSDEVVALFPDTGKSGVAVRRNGNQSKGMFPVSIAEGSADVGFNDSGSAARFFYCAKASKRDRNEGLEEFEEVRDHDGRAEGKVGGNNPRNRTNAAKLNHHPTVKPTSLMQYLVRLVTPAGGTVLDPFMGSGSTGKACVYEGFNFIGIEQSDEYVEIARARIEFAVANKSEMLDVDI